MLAGLRETLTSRPSALLLPQLTLLLASPLLSFSTVTNTGLSDIVPVQEHARLVCALEEVAGVFYIALAVSRLVGITRRRSS